MLSVSRCMALLSVVAFTLPCLSPVTAAPLLVNGGFETGDLSGWTEMSPHYPGSDTSVFAGVLDGGPSPIPYAGERACGWVRDAGNWSWPGHDSTQPSNAIQQPVTVAPGTWPVTVSAAFFCHHDRVGEPEDNWGCGIRLAIYADGDDLFPVWQHELWPREAESYWKYHRALDNEIYDGAPNEITTSTGNLVFEIAWISKWTVDQDLCAVDNVQFELSDPVEDPFPGDAINVQPTYQAPAAIGPGDPGWNATVFAEPAHYPVGFLPRSLATGDFNNDGAPDLVTADMWGHTLTLIFNDGQGGFSSPSFLSCGHNPRCVRVADIDADRDDDIVVSCHGDNVVQVFLGAGDGVFSLPIATETTGGPWRIAVGRINSDEYADLVVPGEFEDEAQVFFGNGDGTFILSDTLSGYDMTASAAIADVDNDRDNDVLVGSWWESRVQVFLNDGAGGLSLTDDFGTPWQTESIVVGDFDRNGLPDVGSAGAHAAEIDFELGNGDGTFTSTPEDHNVRVPTDLALGDWDRDGNDDVVTTNYDTHEISLWRVLNIWQDETSPVAEAGNYAAGRQPRSVVVADFNGDGRDDLAAAAGDDHEVLVYFARPGFRWDGSSTHFPGGWFPDPTGAAAGDFDHDNDLDLAVTVLAGGNHRIHVLRNDGQPILTEQEDIGTELTNVPLGIASADVDHDGDHDLLVSARFVRLYTCDGDLTFSLVGNLRCGTNPTGLVAADFDDDTHPDFAVASSGSDSVYVRLGAGDATFPTEQVIAVGDQPESICAGLFDADEALDLAVANLADDSVSVLINDGSGAFAVASTLAVPAGLTAVRCGDVDGNGSTDLVVVCEDASCVAVLAGNGIGGFAAPVMILRDTPPRGLAVFDASGDGIDDIALGLPDTRAVDLLVADGNGAFDRQTYTAVGPTRALVSAPVWGHERDDLVNIPKGVIRVQVFANDLVFPARFTGIERSDDDIRMTWTAPDTAMQHVESAATPAGPWTPLHTLLDPATTNTWTHPAAAADPNRAYRIRLDF